MKLRFYVFILAMLSVVSCAQPAQDIESSEPQEHVHNWKMCSSEDTATCTEDGIVKQTYVCTICDLTRIEENPSYAKGHRWNNFVEMVEPTCTAEGQRERTCSVCGSIEREPIPTIDHVFYQSSSEPATCISYAVTTYYCGQCGYSYEEYGNEYGDHWYSRTSYKEPTCIVGGSARYECLRCGDSYEETLPSLGGHDYGIIREYSNDIFYNETAYPECLNCGLRYPEGIDFSDYDLPYTRFWVFRVVWDKETNTVEANMYIQGSGIETEANFVFSDKPAEKHKIVMLIGGGRLSFGGDELHDYFVNTTEFCTCTVAVGTLDNVICSGNLSSDLSLAAYGIPISEYMKSDNIVVQMRIGSNLTIDASFDMSEFWRLIRDASTLIESLH